MEKDGKKVVIGVGVAAAIAGIVLLTKGKVPGNGSPEPEPEPPPEPPEEDKANIYGLVTDSQTHEPVVGAMVVLYQDYSQTGTLSRKAYTNESGYYELLDLMVGVTAEMAVTAGGWNEYINQNLSIQQGNIEKNISLRWMGGPREVPRVTGYSFPAGIPSGGEFEAKLKVYLQNFTEYRVSPQLRLYSQENPRCNLTIQYRLVHRSIWEQLRESKKLEYTPFEGEGEIEISDMGVAVCRHFGEDMPPGLYDVSYHLNRSACNVTDTGGLEVWGSETPGYYSAKGGLGEVEVQ